MSFQFPKRTRRRSSAPAAQQLLSLLFSRKAKGQRLVLIVTAIVIGFLWLDHDKKLQQGMSWQGVPKPAQLSLQHWQRVWRNPGFMLGYSEWRRNALWVTYQLNHKPNRRSGKRPQHFTIDQRSLMRVSSDDYLRSGFDRGHLAPNYAIASEYGRAAQLATFKMSNISPQRRNLNQKLWQRLEEVTVDHFLPQQQTLWVITGPIFDEKIEQLNSGVEIPDAFYKIIVAPGQLPAEAKVISFVMPQRVKGTEALSRYLASVDQIEAATGLDFFSALPDQLETQLESNVSDGSDWKLQRVDNNPPRY